MKHRGYSPTSFSMGTKSRRCIAVVLLMVQAAAGYLFAVDPIVWEPVRGADHYRVEIRRGGELVMETPSDTPSLPAFLPAGLYEIRVHVINPFGGIASSSEWSELVVSAPAVPFIVDFAPKEIHGGYSGKTYDFLSHVIGFAPGEDDETPVFFLENSSGKRAALEARKTNVQSDGEFSGTAIELNLAGSKLDAGEWALIMSDGPEREVRLEGALRVRRALKPRIRTVEPREAVSGGKSLTPVTLQVEGAENGAEVLFEGPSVIRANPLSVSEGRILCSLDLADAEPGWYAVSLENPSGSSAVRKRAFRVLEDRTETFTESPAEDEYSRNLLAGYALSLAPGDSRRYFDNGFLGFNLGFAADFHGGVIRRTPALSRLGWEISLSGASNRATYPVVELDAFLIDLTFGLRYITPFDFPFNVLIRTAGGIGSSLHSSANPDRDTDIGGFTIRELDSLDFTLRFGAGIRWDATSRFFVDFTVEAAGVFYLSRAVWFLRPRIDLGIVW